jgi:branched-chain amino acid transport system ATP-binding protein
MLVDRAPIVLRTERLVTGYGTRSIINQVDIEVSAGEVVAVIGHNGAGKSTLLKAMFGLLPVWSGTVKFAGVPHAKTPRALLRGGVVYVPQGNQIFSRLTVLENLELSALVLGRQFLTKRIKNSLELFPTLRERINQRAGSLSGGEKQMLSLACAMSLNPRILLLDEPSSGLSSTLTKNALNRIASICRNGDVSALVVEQKVRQVLSIADRVYALRNGTVTFSGPATALADEAMLREVML